MSVLDASERGIRRPRPQDYYRVKKLTDPAAGAEVSIVVPGGRIWTPLALTVTLVADANVANRRLNLLYDDQTDVFARVTTSTTVTAGQTRVFSLLAEAGADVDDSVSNVIQGRLPGIPLLPGTRIRTLTAGIQVGDNYSAPVLYVSEDELRGLAAELAHELLVAARRLGPVAVSQQ